MYAPTHSAALASDATANAPNGILSAPAIGGPTVEKPGTNFDTTTEKKPQRSKIASMCHPRHPNGRYRADMVANADFAMPLVLLQRVGQNPGRLPGGRDNDEHRIAAAAFNIDRGPAGARGAAARARRRRRLVL